MSEWSKEESKSELKVMLEIDSCRNVWCIELSLFLFFYAIALWMCCKCKCNTATNTKIIDLSLPSGSNILPIIDPAERVRYQPPIYPQKSYSTNVHGQTDKVIWGKLFISLRWSWTQRTLCAVLFSNCTFLPFPLMAAADLIKPGIALPKT